MDDLFKKSTRGAAIFSDECYQREKASRERKQACQKLPNGKKFSRLNVLFSSAAQFKKNLLWEMKFSGGIFGKKGKSLPPQTPVGQEKIRKDTRVDSGLVEDEEIVSAEGQEGEDGDKTARRRYDINDFDLEIKRNR